ncbi:MAG: FG-GAP repeat domain-containing protein [Candidatus Helarchaeota archaeon]
MAQTSGHLSIQTIITGDFDNDGKKEFVAGGIDGKILVYEDTGTDNSLQCVWSTQWDIETHITRLVDGNDTDNDGNREFVAATLGSSPTENSLYVFENTGNDNYVLRWNSSGYGGYGIKGLAAGDPDSDGKKDIFAGNQNGAVFNFEYNGTDNVTDYEVTWQNSSIVTGGSIVGLLLHDFDNDTLDELVVVGSGVGISEIHVFEATGVDNQYNETWTYTIPLLPEIYDICFVNDSNVNGFSEFLVGTSGQMLLFERAGNDNYTIIWTSGPLTNFRAVTSGVLDGDQGPELIGATPNDVQVFENNSIGQYPRVWLYSFLQPPLINPQISSISAAEDLDGDGLPELIVAGDSVNPRIFVFEYTGVDNQLSLVWNDGSDDSDDLISYLEAIIVIVILVVIITVAVFAVFIGIHFYTQREDEKYRHLMKKID